MEESAQIDQDVTSGEVDAWTLYVPSSTEKKRAVVMYVLFGIVMTLNKKELSVFEYYHLKQASGWWVTFVFLFLASAILLLIPVIKYLWLIPLVAMLLLLWYFIKNAFDWKYASGSKKWPLDIFGWIGAWLLSLFEIKQVVVDNDWIVEWWDVDLVDPTSFVQSTQSVEPVQKTVEVGQEDISKETIGESRDEDKL